MTRRPLRPLRWRGGRLEVLDQTRLPFQVVWLRLRRAREVARAIQRLSIRGAPAIGVAAAYGLALEGRDSGRRPVRERLSRAAHILVRARPTAVNLSWAVRRVLDEALTAPNAGPAALAAAMRLEQEEAGRSQAIARHGAALVGRGAVMLTICNTGVLAATGAGTALGIILQAQREGKRPVVFACETRPLLQGARLTIFELRRAGVDVRLMVDSAAASVVGRCDMVLTGADRIARNGDTANKVGTRMLAVLARHARKPFYVAAPSSTLDPSCRSGADIPIEERSASEVRSFGRCRTTLPDTAVYNPAFDVTPGRFVSGFVFEGGVVRPPYQRSLKTLTREQTARPGFWAGPHV